ncbi:MAG: hypothetical protein WEB57_08055 [Pseudohongiellaceae bacterium]
MDARLAHDILLPATLAMFPEHFSSRPARAMVLAIGLQESDYIHRRQLIGNHRNWWEVIKPPAKSFHQFEKVGIRGVVEHPATRRLAVEVCRLLGYPPDVNVLHAAVEHNDLLASAFARLALWRLPQPLPGPDDHQEAWAQYLEAWQPGKPKPERWQHRYQTAWDIVGVAA